MNKQSAYSTTATTTTTTQGSTHGFMSFSSQNYAEGANGPNLKERIAKNLCHLSTNMNRYTGFPDLLFNLAMVIRFIQVYGLFLFPSVDKFWKTDKSTYLIIQIFSFLMHLCIAYKSTIYHQVLIIVLFFIFLVNGFIETKVLLHNPFEKSHSNSTIFYLNFVNVVLIPIASFFVFSDFGVISRLLFFEDKATTLNVMSFIIGLLTIVLVIMQNYVSFILIRNAPRVNFNILCRPWGARLAQYFWLDMYFLVLAFLEEMLPINNNWMLLIFSLCLLLFANPGIIVYLLRYPVFNDYSDCKYLCSMATTGLWSVLLINIRVYATGLTPTIILSSFIIVFVISHFVYTWLTARIESSYLMKLYSVYKQSQPVLPPTSAFIFSSNQQNQVPLTQEAYTVMQAFLSLDINTPREFQMATVIGANAHMPAVRNIDFVKWGLNYFNDEKSLFICTQICNHFRENAQTQTVLLQYLREYANLTPFTNGILNILDYDHTDVISDNPRYLKVLKNKAIAAQARCRKCTSSFWRSVLNHSIPTMSDGICRLRDAIEEAQSHYDELMRCYPLSLDAISLYMSFLIESKAAFIQCHDFINETSSKFIELKSDVNDYAQSVDSVSILMKETNKSYSEYLHNLSAYTEQERRVTTGTSTPIVAIWILTIVSFLVIISFTIAIIAVSLTHFQSYPSYLEVIRSGSDVIIELASLTLSTRRLCLFSEGLISNHSNQTEDKFFYDDFNELREYVLEHAEKLPYMINHFFSTTIIDSDLIKQLSKGIGEIYMFDEIRKTSLSTTIEIMALSIRNIITNIPSFYGNGTVDLENMSSICTSTELKTLAYNIRPISMLTRNFIEEFKRVAQSKIQNLDTILYYSMIILPVSFVVVFNLLLWITVTYIKSESRFRMTLYLSFPETVASGVIHKINLIEKKQLVFHGGSVISNGSNYSSYKRKGSTHSSNISSAEETRSKALTIENLYQFSIMSNSNSTTGSTGYCISMIFFLVFGAIAMFALTIYAKTVNSEFTDRSFMICNAAQRFATLQYATMLASETYVSHLENIKLFKDKQLHTWADEFITLANSFHKILTYGDETVRFDYREYKGIAALLDGTNIPQQKYEPKIHASASAIQHDGYKSLGFESRLQLLLTATSGIISCFENNSTYYSTLDESWGALNHLLLTHISDDLLETSDIYFEGVNTIIKNSFIISLLISVVSVIVLLLIFIGPILHFSNSLTRYFKLTTQILALVPPKIFENTIYLQKWMQGSITKKNFSQYSVTFNRTVSPQLQARVASISPERIFIFTTEGKFVDIGSINTKSLPDTNLNTIMSIYFDLTKDSHLIDSINLAFIKFHEAKDKTDTIVIKENSKDGVPMDIKIVGITSADTVSIMDNEIQNFYAFVAILIVDVTAETEDEKKYQEQRAVTLELLEASLPKQFAEKVHNGDSSITFSAGIGTILKFEICNYQEIGKTCEPSVVGDLLSSLRREITDILMNFPNVSMISIRNGKAFFIAGLFNEDQNGRTETEDTINFTVEVDRLFMEMSRDRNIKIDLRYGVATGGSIYCRLLMETAPITIIDGDIVGVADKLLEMAKPRQMMIEKTTCECGTGLDMDPIESGEFMYNDRTFTCYSVDMDSFVQE